MASAARKLLALFLPAKARSVSAQWEKRIDLVRSQIENRRFDKIDNELQQLDCWLAELPPQTPELPDWLNELGELYQNFGGNNIKAEEAFRRACSAAEAIHGESDIALSVPLNSLAVFLLQQRRADEARQLLERLLPIVEGHFGPDHSEVATCLENLAAVLRQQDKTSEATALRNRAVRIRVHAKDKTSEE